MIDSGVYTLTPPRSNRTISSMIAASSRSSRHQSTMCRRSFFCPGIPLMALAIFSGRVSSGIGYFARRAAADSSIEGAISGMRST